MFDRNNPLVLLIVFKELIGFAFAHSSLLSPGCGSGFGPSSFVFPSTITPIVTKKRPRINLVMSGRYFSSYFEKVIIEIEPKKFLSESIGFFPTALYN